MRNANIWRSALAGLLVCGAQLMAQTTAAVPVYLYASTSGMVGVTAVQTARLNVLNMNPVPSSTTKVAACPVQLQFIDAQNKVLKQASVADLSPGTATLLDLRFADVTAPTLPREQLRAVVQTGLLPTATTTQTVLPATFVAAARCNVVATLEVYDNVTSQTQFLTSDFRAVPLATLASLLDAIGR